MRIDLFEFVEGVIRGVVYFLYNLIETIWQILRHPVRGPAALYRAHIRKGQQQIGGLTLLFLVLLLLHSILLRGFDGNETDPDRLFNLLAETSVAIPSLDANAMWPALVASLTSTVIIDAVLRLALRRRLPANPNRRRRLLASAEYALLWMWIAVGLAVFILVGNGGAILFSGIGLPTVAMAVWTIVSLVATAFPAALILRSAARRSRQRSEGLAALLALALVGLFALALCAGFAFGAEVQDRREGHESHAEQPQISTLRCERMPDGRVEVDGLMRVESGWGTYSEDTAFYVVFVDVRGQSLPGFESWGERLEWRRPDASHFVVVGNADPRVLELQTAGPVNIPEDEFCSLRMSGVPNFNLTEIRVAKATPR